MDTLPLQGAPRAARRKGAALRGLAAAAALAAGLLASAPAAEAAPDFYWEAPVRLSRGNGAYPQAVSVPDPESYEGGQRVVAVWQDNVSSGDGGNAWLSAVSYDQTGAATRLDRFAGPFAYRGNPVPLFSAAADSRGAIAVAVSADERNVAFYLSDDGGLSFRRSALIDPGEPVVAPRVFPRATGGWFLFALRGQTESFSILLARSDDGSDWSSFAPLLPADSGLRLSFLPVAAPAGGTDVVVFQSLAGDTRASYQLYSQTSADGGASWTAPRRVTDFQDPVRRDQSNIDAFNNQRPHLAPVAGQLWLAWERSVLSGKPQVYAARLDQGGAAVAGTVSRVTNGAGECQEARVMDAEGTPSVVWFDNRSGPNRVYAAFKEGFIWNERELSTRVSGTAELGRAVYANRGLWAFWQSGSGGSYSILALTPDTSVLSPELSGADFVPGVATRSPRATLRWTVPADSSGIKGFSYLWSRDPAAVPPREELVLETVTRAVVEADEDGDWYFAVRAVDYAGNWSSTTRLRFVRDTTPPSAPRVLAPRASADGFLASSSFSVDWAAPPETDVAGYSWILEYLGPLDRLPARKRPAPDPALPAADYALEPATDYELELWSSRQPAEPAPKILGAAPRASFSNLEDGYWSLSVAAVDRTGNMGAAARVILRNDKFVPFTLVSDVLSERDDFGTLRLRLVGRGFTEDGPVTRVALDDDGKPPFEREFSLADGQFTIRSDRMLEGAEASDLPKGMWRVGVFHPVRGWYFTAPLVSVDERGTVKFGERGPAWKPSWVFSPPPRSLIDLGTLFMLAALALPLAGMLLSLRQVSLVLAEGRAIRLEALALLEGKPMPVKERERAAKAALHRGGGLTAKFVLTISMLVLFVVALVSVPIAMQMIRDQSSALASGLEQRAKVLLESAAAGGRSYLPGRNAIELSYVPGQRTAIKDARYLTITGFGTERNTSPEAVWATDDPDILTRVDTPQLIPGKSFLSDALTPSIEGIARSVDEQAAAAVGSLIDAQRLLIDESTALATKLDDASQARYAELAAQVQVYNAEIKARLADLADASVSSLPAFDPANLSLDPQEFIFYKPILFSVPGQPVYYRGMVRLAITTDLIVAQVIDARARLIRSILIVAAIALGAGVAGSVILAGVIINPIRKLVKGIETIRDTPDKKDLANFSIEVKSKDELATLAATINEMTLGLVVAANEAEFLTLGKETQKMFIPLDTNSLGEKLTTGKQDETSHSFFGYYEGAKGVSGDYFDYQKLDERYWAFIKCDVSGKGIPAALIMVGVATIFSSAFQGWSYARDGIKLDKLAFKINDFLYGRGFKGKFAALFMGVYDSKTGAVHVCHAGDNRMYVYSARQRKLLTETLPEAPATGMFDNDLVEMKSPYAQVARKMEAGDLLVLFTDGFEESTRLRRKPDFSVIMEKKVERDREGKETVHEEEAKEQLEQERIDQAVEAIMAGGRFSLVKQDDPLGPGVSYDFDFSSMTGSPEDLVLGLAAIEKVFRMVPDPKAADEDMVLVDTKVDAVLERCFLQYGSYCRGRIDHPDPRRTEYKYYKRLKEDEQYDDLTMMVIRRNA